MPVTTVTVKFQVTSTLRDDTRDFFHLDAEIFHNNVYEAQILSFDKESSICVAELYLESAVDENNLSDTFKAHRLSVSVDNREIEFSHVTYSA